MEKTIKELWYEYLNQPYHSKTVFDNLRKLEELVRYEESLSANPEEVPDYTDIDKLDGRLIEINSPYFNFIEWVNEQKVEGIEVKADDGLGYVSIKDYAGNEYSINIEKESITALLGIDPDEHEDVEDVYFQTEMWVNYSEENATESDRESLTEFTGR